jgi:hypothetical protein
MQASSKAARKAAAALPDNSLARKAIENIQLIEEEAKAKKMAQLESLQSAKAALHERINELNHQLVQIDNAIASIKGAPEPKKERRPRRNLDEDRERVARWLTGRKGQKFGAGDLVREFPELEGVVMSIFLKPLMQAGHLQTDTTEGIRRTKYFVAE